MTVAARITLTLCLFMLLAALSACGTAGLGPQPERLSLDEALAGVEQLVPPEGVDGTQFAQLKGALKAALIETGQGGFMVHPPQGPGSVVDDLTLALLPGGQQGIQWTYKNPGDYNFDGQTNASDIAQVALHFGKGTSSSDWDKAQYVDGDGNGLITVADITPIASNFLGTLTAYQVESAASLGGPWQPLTQVALTEGVAPAELIVPAFEVPVGYYAPYFRVYALDSQGNAAEPSLVCEQLYWADNVWLLGQEGQPSFVSREGLAVRLNVPEDQSLSVGDILVGQAGGGFVLRIDELVLADTELTAHCSPASLQDAIASGRLEFDLEMDSPFELDLAGIELVPTPDVRIKVGAGRVRCWPQGKLLANFDAHDGLNYLQANFYDDVILDLDMEVSASGGSLDSASAASINQEKLLATYNYDYPYYSYHSHMGVWVPVLATYKVYFGVGGAGQIDGIYRQQVAGAFGNISAQAAWQPGTAPQFGLTYSPEFETAAEPEMTGTGSASIIPYVRIEASFRTFYGADQPLTAPDASISLLAAVPLDYRHVTLPSTGVNYTESTWAAGEFTATLARFGVDDSISLSDTVDPFEIRSGFNPPVEADTFSLTGRVWAPQGAVVPHLEGVKVTLSDEYTNVIGVRTTGFSGTFAFDGIEAGKTVVVTPSHAAYKFDPPVHALTLTQHINVEFSSQRTFVSIGGLVTDSFNEVIPGVTITLDSDDPNYPLTLTTMTDELGWYILQVPTGLKAHLEPSHPYYTFSPFGVDFTATSNQHYSFIGEFSSGP